jgi:hypothetical protein
MKIETVEVVNHTDVEQYIEVKISNPVNYQFFGLDLDPDAEIGRRNVGNTGFYISAGNTITCSIVFWPISIGNHDLCTIHLNNESLGKTVYEIIVSFLLDRRELA